MKIIDKGQSVVVLPGGTKAFRFLDELQKSEKFYATLEGHHVFRVYSCRVGGASGFYFKLDSQCADSRKAVVELVADLKVLLAPYQDKE